MDRLVYVDHAATTPVKQEVLEEMQPYFTQKFGNPSSIYSMGRDNKKVLDEAREKVAKAINSIPEEIYFTSGGTEADNWAIKGVAYANKHKGNHIITSSIEHHAVLHTCEFLEKQGFKVTYLPVDSDGVVSLTELEKAITDETVLITIMYANNEIGTIQPIKEIGDIAKQKDIIFHTDAVQAIGNIEIDVSDLNVDLLSISAHKMYGPKGIGALYIRKDTKITSILQGGAQEKGARAGTENIPGIVGLGKAIEVAHSSLDEYNNKIKSLRDKFIERIKQEIPHVRLNGHPEKRLPGNANFSFEFIEGESLLLMLDARGICASSGSACTSGSLDPSHVLLSIGLSHEIAHGSLRVTFGEENTMSDVDYIVDNLISIVDRLRQMSPLYEEMKRGNEHV